MQTPFLFLLYMFYPLTHPVFLYLHHSADVSDDLKDLLFKMLDKNPENRITVPQIKVSLYEPV